jgi:very-short-patch-repair endonuclease
MTVAGWRAVGVPYGQLRALVRSGDLVQVRRGVYATRRAVAFGERDAMRTHAFASIGVLRRIPGAVVSHHSAALIHGLEMLDPPDGSIVTVTLPPGSRGDVLGSERVVRHRAALPAGHVVTLVGTRVTSPARTVADIARMSTFMQGVVVADSALRHEKAHAEQLRLMAEACAGWPGAKRARRVAEFAHPWAESVLESIARVVFNEHGLQAPELQKEFRIEGKPFRVDFYWPDAKVIAETDGLVKYDVNPRQQAIQQLERDKLLRRTRNAVVHFTWKEFFRDGGQGVVAELRENGVRYT